LQTLCTIIGAGPIGVCLRWARCAGRRPGLLLVATLGTGLATRGHVGGNHPGRACRTEAVVEGGGSQRCGRGASRTSLARGAGVAPATAVRVATVLPLRTGRAHVGGTVDGARVARDAPTCFDVLARRNTVGGGQGRAGCALLVARNRLVGAGIARLACVARLSRDRAHVALVAHAVGDRCGCDDQCSRRLRVRARLADLGARPDLTLVRTCGAGRALVTRGLDLACVPLVAQAVRDRARPWRGGSCRRCARARRALGDAWLVRPCAGRARHTMRLGHDYFAGVLGAGAAHVIRAAGTLLVPCNAGHLATAGLGTTLVRTPLTLNILTGAATRRDIGPGQLGRRQSAARVGVSGLGRHYCEEEGTWHVPRLRRQLMTVAMGGCPTHSTIRPAIMLVRTVVYSCTTVQGSAILLSRCAAAILQRALLIYRSSSPAGSSIGGPCDLSAYTSSRVLRSSRAVIFAIQQSF
jgi:hypothetical protein